MAGWALSRIILKPMTREFKACQWRSGHQQLAMSHQYNALWCLLYLVTPFTWCSLVVEVIVAKNKLLLIHVFLSGGLMNDRQNYFYRNFEGIVWSIYSWETPDNLLLPSLCASDQDKTRPARHHHEHLRPTTVIQEFYLTTAYAMNSYLGLDPFLCMKNNIHRVHSPIKGWVVAPQKAWKFRWANCMRLRVTRRQILSIWHDWTTHACKRYWRLQGNINHPMIYVSFQPYLPPLLWNVVIFLVVPTLQSWWRWFWYVGLGYKSK